MNNTYYILISICILIVLSYLFNIISEKTKIPSVILLIAAGIGIQFLGKETHISLPNTSFLLEILGIVGLIFIVLEGSLDLKINRTKMPMIGKSLLISICILLVTSGVICSILYYGLSIPFRNALIYAVPLGIISSAIAIPSVNKLASEKKEFVIYESTFSDILGIMLFNYVINENLTGGASIGNFFLSLVIILLISFASTMLLLFLLNYTKSHAKFYLVFAVLILVYSLSKIIHLPSLLLILIFGVMLNNAESFIKGKLANYLHPEKLKSLTGDLKTVTIETAFIVRTFFFLIFGYTINLHLLNDVTVFTIGSLIIITILITRYIFLRFVSRTNLYPELFIAPRGLITIVLFYSIPAQWQTDLFNEGILLFVIILSALIMMAALMLSKTEYNNLDKI
jgi:Kef-type K+ transport system membrane component KefB